MSEVDWSQFDDWLEYGGTGGVWPSIFESKELTEEQKQVVERNAALLLDRKAWQRRIEAFEEALANIKDKDKREEKLSKFRIRFDSCIFDRELYPDLNFKFFKFPCSVSFKSVVFGDGDVNFTGSIFSYGDITFVEAVFGEGVVTFNFSKFNARHVSFEGAKFGKGEVNFSFVTFDIIIVNFSKMHLSNETFFNAIGMMVEGTLLLRSHFRSETMFVNLKVSESVLLGSSSYENCPDFRFAVFGRPPEVNGMIVPKPKMKGEKLFYIFKTCSDVEDAPKYRKLKAMALAANDHDKDGEFFAYEMTAKCGHEITGFWELLANSFYYHVSNYGQSWIRPLIGMGISFFVFFWLYFIYAMGSLKCLENVWFSIKYSMLNTLPFVSALYRSSIQPKDYESGLMVDLDKLATVDGEMVNGSLGGLMFLSFCQQFIGIVLLFFLLLGLRNRFRLK